MMHNYTPFWSDTTYVPILIITSDKHNSGTGKHKA